MKLTSIPILNGLFLEVDKGTILKNEVSIYYDNKYYIDVTNMLTELLGVPVKVTIHHMDSVKAVSIEVNSTILTKKILSLIESHFDILFITSDGNTFKIVCHE